MRNPGNALKKKNKGKKGLDYSGPSVMSTSIESSKFKSAFGNLKPVEPRRLNPKALANAQNRRANRKPLSFFDSQRVDPSMMYNTNDP